MSSKVQTPLQQIPSYKATGADGLSPKILKIAACISNLLFCCTPYKSLYYNEQISIQVEIGKKTNIPILSYIFRLTMSYFCGLRWRSQLN